MLSGFSYISSWRIYLAQVIGGTEGHVLWLSGRDDGEAGLAWPVLEMIVFEAQRSPVEILSVGIDDECRDEF